MESRVSRTLTLYHRDIPGSQSFTEPPPQPRALLRAQALTSVVQPCLSLPSVRDYAVSPGPAPSPFSVSSCLPPPSSCLFYRMWESCTLWPADKAHICRMPAIVIRVHGPVKSLAGRISCVLTLVGLEFGQGEALCNVLSLFSSRGRWRWVETCVYFNHGRNLFTIKFCCFSSFHQMQAA